jgi:small-conductance mechanosensitive channel
VNGTATQNATNGTTSGVEQTTNEAIDLLQQFESLEARLAITAVLLLAVGGLYLFASHRAGALRERTTPAFGDVTLATAMLVVGVTAVTALIVLWDAEPAANSLLQRTQLDPFDGVLLLLTLVTLATTYVATEFLQRAIDRFAESKDTISEHQTEVVYRVAQITAYVVAITVVLAIWQVDLSGLLVGAGFLGIIVGMAARQTLGSLLAGFVLMFSRPFEVGDWVEIEDHEGIVTDISIVNTRIQTFDGEFVMYPNDVVSGSTIVNRSRKGRIRLEVDVGIDYDADVERASEIAVEAMRDVDDVMSVPDPKVVTKEFGDSSVVLGLRFWIDKPSARRKWRAQTAVINAVKEVFDEEGVEIPFPQRVLDARSDQTGVRVAGGQSANVETTTDGGSEGDDR